MTTIALNKEENSFCVNLRFAERSKGYGCLTLNILRIARLVLSASLKSDSSGEIKAK